MGNEESKRDHNGNRRRKLFGKWQNAALVFLGIVLVGAVAFALHMNSAPIAADSEAASKQYASDAETKWTAAMERQKAEQDAKIEAAKLKVHRPGDRPLSVLFAGDSMTEGAHATSPENSFTGRIETALGERGDVETVTIGGSGFTAAKTIPQAKDVEAGADVAFVALGTNDVLLDKPEAFKKEYPALLDAIRETSPDAALVCAGVWTGGAQTGSTLDRVIRAECEERGGRFVNLNPIRRTNGVLATKGTVLPDGMVADGSHPNDRGHGLIAEALLSAIKVTAS